MLPRQTNRTEIGCGMSVGFARELKECLKACRRNNTSKVVFEVVVEKCVSGRKWKGVRLT